MKSCSSFNTELCNLMVTAAKAAPTITGPTRPSLFVSVRLGSPAFLVGSSTTWDKKLSSEPPALLVLCCFASPEDVRVVKGPQEPGPVAVGLLPAACRRPHPLPLNRWHAANTHNGVTLIVCPFILTKAKLGTLQVLTHIKGNSTTAPSWSVSPKQPVALHDNIPVTGAIPPCP